METALTLCYEHSSARFAFLYTRRKSAHEIKRMVSRMEAVASMYGGLIGEVHILPVNETDHPERQAFVIFPRNILPQEIMEKLVLSLFQGTNSRVGITWITDTQKVGEALEIAKNLLKA